MNRLSRILGAVRHQLSAHVPRMGAATQTAPTETTDTKTTTVVPKKEDNNEGLMAFFDTKDNWSLNDVRVGRSWRKEELRIKSNQDLHKLWYVLLKERNMLLSMQHELLHQWESLPSPERIDKVHESMVNLEEVVRERNRAYYQLETGETGERPGKVAINPLGMPYFYKMSEHVLPPQYNNHWFVTRRHGCNRREVAKFRLYLNEQRWLEKKRGKNREFRHVMQLYKRYPDLDEDALREQYPDVDLERVKRLRGAEGHFTPRNV